jgi:hypothetical protein
MSADYMIACRRCREYLYLDHAGRVLSQSASCKTGSSEDVWCRDVQEAFPVPIVTPQMLSVAAESEEDDEKEFGDAPWVAKAAREWTLKHAACPPQLLVDNDGNATSQLIEDDWRRWEPSPTQGNVLCDRGPSCIRIDGRQTGMRTTVTVAGVKVKGVMAIDLKIRPAEPITAVMEVVLPCCDISVLPTEATVTTRPAADPKT